jgi:glutamyl-tRNA synthetase
MVLLRSDGSPVYMLAVVVDDYDMGVTHVIRGDDHLNNAARQIQIYRAMGWELPTYAHIPLIHGPDGKKMSKRHGATGVEEYQALGYSAAGMRNYLARLGWSHGDDEFFNDSQAQSWFDLEHIGKSPARFDFKKLTNISGQHIAQTDDAALLHELEGYLVATDAAPLNDAKKSLFLSGAYCVKERAKTMAELFDKSAFMFQSRPLDREEKAVRALDSVSIGILNELTPQLRNAIWTREELEGLVERLALSHETKMGKLAAPLRAALSGRVTSPSVFDMMLVLGRDETIARLTDIS